MKIIGLTGGLASGKSTVAAMFQALGAKVIDADQIARSILLPGYPCYQKVINAFGTGILQASSEFSNPPLIDRNRLAEIIFTDDAARKKLNAIMHPEIAKRSAEQILTWKQEGVPLVIYEAALLVETERYQALDALIVVDIPLDLQVSRAITRGLSQSQAMARIEAQASQENRLAFATYVIDNSGCLENTEMQVYHLWQKFLQPT